MISKCSQNTGNIKPHYYMSPQCRATTHTNTKKIQHRLQKLMNQIIALILYNNHKWVCECIAVTVPLPWHHLRYFGHCKGRHVSIFEDHRPLQLNTFEVANRKPKSNDLTVVRFTFVGRFSVRQNAFTKLPRTKHCRCDAQIMCFW